MARFLPHLAALGLAVTSAVAAAQTRTPAPIIDMHLHAHPPEEFLRHRLGAPDECALPTLIPPLDVTRAVLRTRSKPL